MNPAFIEVEGVAKTYQLQGGLTGARRQLHAVAGLSFSVPEGTTFGLVGESGSGKTTTARLVMGAERATQGTIRIAGRDIASLDSAGLMWLRRTLQPVLQDPYSSLNPRMRIGRIIDEPMRIHRVEPDRKRLAARVEELLRHVGLSPGHASHYPHEMSGGQRQRVAIARALALTPSCIVLDEPVSALDVSVQAQILNLLKDLQADRRLTYVMISHDLAVIAYMSDQIGVLYLGQFMEIGPRDAIVRDARHPYTRALMAAAKPGRVRELGADEVRGEIPSPLNPPSGCPFHPRCPMAQARCASEKPALRPLGSGQHVACHFA